MTSERYAVGLLVGVVLGMTGCGVGGDPAEPVVARGGMSWEEFLGHVYQEPETGVYIADGDTPFEDVKLLREFWETNVRDGALIVHQSGGVDVKWTDTQKLNLTYCVSTSFGGNYSTVVQAMASAAAAWEAVANVDLIHVSAQDTSCTSSNANVLFDVNPVNAGGQYLARAFFPNQTRSTRNILIDGSAFTTTPPLTLTGILRHELGHVLGFRHEHTRPEAAGGTPTTEVVSGSLSTGQTRTYGPYSVVPGTTFSAVMTGTGDPDLYVRFGSPPTTSSYNCRPYLTGANETCNLTVPAGQTVAYVMVRGYTSATYSVTISYTKPATGGGTPTTQTFSGSVAQGQNVYPGNPYSVLAGTTFSASMTGTGDPDLYVRFGANPTTTAYDCRPYLAGATESCTLTVPSGQSSAYVMIRGYTSGTYNLTVSYTKP